MDGLGRRVEADVHSWLLPLFGELGHFSIVFAAVLELLMREVVEEFPILQEIEDILLRSREHASHLQ